MSSAPRYAEFADPLLAGVYDFLNPFGEDGEFFCRLAGSIGAKKIADLGCGTGLLTMELARRGHQMTGIEPALPMLNLARAKDPGGLVEWRQGSFEQLEGVTADLVLMTSHVAQFFLEAEDWREALLASKGALRERGWLVFDIRVLADPPFPCWPTSEKRERRVHPSLGAIEWWHQAVQREGRRVSYELHYHFADRGQTIVSQNELAFPTREAVEADLAQCGFKLGLVYGDWRGGRLTEDSREMIFVARSLG